MTTALTTGAPWRVILVFSVPLLIGNVVQQLYQVVDAIVVGRQLGIDSLAAVGATGSLLFLLLGFAWGVTSGFAIPTAQAFGSGDLDAVRRSVAAGTLLTGAMSVALTIGAPLIAGPALQLLQTPEELLAEATVFAQISFVGASAVMFFNYLSAVIRAIGDSRTPLVFLTLSCLLNIGLVVLMVGPLDWGVAGQPSRRSSRRRCRSCCASTSSAAGSRCCTCAAPTGGCRGPRSSSTCASACRWASRRRSSRSARSRCRWR